MSPEEAGARLAALVSGDAVIGEEEQVFALLSVDADGSPRSCALSRTEIAVDGLAVHVAVHARRPTANIERDERATLVAYDGDAILAIRLALASGFSDAGLFAARLDIVGAEADSLGIPLRPPTFVATAEVSILEHWDRTRAALAVLAARHTGG
jgi:hypothetical protein